MQRHELTNFSPPVDVAVFREFRLSGRDSFYFYRLEVDEVPLHFQRLFAIRRLMEYDRSDVLIQRRMVRLRNRRSAGRIGDGTKVAPCSSSAVT